MKKCVQCKKDFEPKKPKAKFCSVNCRVQYFREEKKRFNELMKHDKPLEEILAFAFGKEEAEVILAKITEQFAEKVVVHPPVDLKKHGIPLPKSELEKIADKDNIHPKSLNQPKSDIAKQIAAIEAEKIPKERDTRLGRAVWYNDQQKRISELKNKLQ